MVSGYLIANKRCPKISANGFGLCVRWRFKLQILNQKQKIDMSTNDKLKNETANDGNTLLSAGFQSKREQKRFAKLLTYAVIYQQGGDWDEEVISDTRNFCESEAKRLGFPDGWKNLGTYDELKRWFFQTCR